MAVFLEDNANNLRFGKDSKIDEEKDEEEEGCLLTTLSNYDDG